MKKIGLMLIGSVFALNTFAQEVASKGSAEETYVKENKYCAEMQDGKIKVMMDENVLNADVTLANGTRITSDAWVIKRDGSKIGLKAGQCVDLEGNVMDEKTKYMKDNEMKKD
jgi:hypothetical protein